MKDLIWMSVSQRKKLLHVILSTALARICLPRGKFFYLVTYSSTWTSMHLMHRIDQFEIIFQSLNCGLTQIPVVLGNDTFSYLREKVFMTLLPLKS